MSVVSEKFQVVIPADVRRESGIRAGMRVRVTRYGNGVLIEPETASVASAGSGRGLVKADRHVSIESMNGASGRDAAGD